MIEIMVVLVIIGAMTAMVIPRLSNKNNQIKAAVRHLGVLAKESHNHAKLYGNTYRIVIDMKEGPNSDEQLYWVEQSNAPFVLPKDKNSILEADKNKDKDDEETSTPGFEPAVRLMKQPKALPGNLKFTSVEVVGINRPIESGKVYIHFFPRGLVEEAVIQLSAGEELNWSIALHPLTGKADIITRKVSLREVSGK